MFPARRLSIRATRSSSCVSSQVGDRQAASGGIAVPEYSPARSETSFGAETRKVAAVIHIQRRHGDVVVSVKRLALLPIFAASSRTCSRRSELAGETAKL